MVAARKRGGGLRTFTFSVAQIILGLSIPAYLVARYLDLDLGYAQGLEIPLISASLILLMSGMRRVEEMINNDSYARVRPYADHQAFYNELRARVIRATSTVHTSYLRSYPPSELGVAPRRYFEACLEWAASSPTHQFRRVIVRPLAHDNGLQEWIDEQVSFAADLRGHGANFNIRQLDWQLSGPDALSVAIIDDEYVFVAFSGERDSLAGFSIRSKLLVERQFKPYYERLWGAAKPATLGAATS